MVGIVGFDFRILLQFIPFFFLYQLVKLAGPYTLAFPVRELSRSSPDGDVST